MLTGSQDLPQKSLQIKQDDKFFSRLMSKETSMANCSSRVYYVGASGAVPFTWESQPGTPKHPITDTTLPPLTPPPSYQSTSSSKTLQKNMKPNLFNTILPRLTPKKNHVSPSSSSWSCTSSSSSSSSSSWSSSYSFPSRSKNSSKFRRRRCFSCSTLPVQYDYGIDDEEEHQGHGSPTSPLCFGVKPRTFNGRRGCYSLVNMKNAFLSIVGHGSTKAFYCVSFGISSSCACKCHWRRYSESVFRKNGFKE